MGRDIFRSLGLDPGSRNFGYAVLDVDLTKASKGKFEAEVSHMDSLLVDQVVRQYEERWFGRTDRQRRLKSCGEFTMALLDTFDPEVVVIEDAYLNRRQPTSYRSLSEGIIYLVESVREWDPTVPILITEAMRAKKAVGAKPKRGDDQKAIVKAAIKNNKSIILPPNFEEKSEHSIDAVALAYFGCDEWWLENGVLYTLDFLR